MAKRKVCHECGTEITNRPRYQIYKAGEIMTVCQLCHARHMREWAKRKGSRLRQ